MRPVGSSIVDIPDSDSRTALVFLQPPNAVQDNVSAGAPRISPRRSRECEVCHIDLTHRVSTGATSDGKEYTRKICGPVLRSAERG